MTPSTSPENAKSPTPLNANDIHTQGNNFLHAVQTSADPRTGQFNLGISLALGQANLMGGPSWSFSLAYSALSSQRDSGFGLGWSLMYTRLIREQSVWTLTLSSGEHFSVDLEQSSLQPGGRLVFQDYKLHAMQVAVLATDGNDAELTFRILHKTGDQEFLRRVGGTGNTYALHELRSTEGRSLHLDWLRIGNDLHLLTVRDQTRVMARYDRLQRTLTLEPGSAQQSITQFVLTNGELVRLLLPEIAKPFAFRYANQIVGDQHLRLPVEITGPLGATDTINWSQTPESSHRLPAKAPIAFMPRVLSWLHSDGSDTPALLRRYTWTGSRNYLGGDSPQGFDWQVGRDSLYRLMTRYEYRCNETQYSGDLSLLSWVQAGERFDAQGSSVQVAALLDGLVANGAATSLTTIDRTWDRHHLLLKEVTLSGDCETTRETVYGVDYDKPWSDQPAQCQLPHVVSTTYANIRAQSRSSEVTRYEYDSAGNVLSTLFPNQVEEVSEYYPASGALEGAPFDASGMVRLLKQKTVYPAPNCPGNPPVLCTRLEYAALPSLVAGDADHPVVGLETLLDLNTGEVLETTQQTYERGDPNHYGRLKNVVTTLGGIPTTTDFDYALTYEADEPLLRTETRVQGFEKTEQVTSTWLESRSLISGLTRWEVSAAGARTDFDYDALGRAIRTRVAQGTAYQAERTCAYHVDDEFAADHAPRQDGQPAVRVGLEETDATGQRRRTWLDGSSRPVLVQLEDLDHRPGAFAEVARMRYDAWGRLVEQIESDWSADGTQLYSLATQTQYDDWGGACRQTFATGVTACTANDPSRRYVEHWQQSPAGLCTGKQTTTSNVVGSPVQITQFDDRGRLARTTDYLRDGLDRVIEERVSPADGQPRVTQFEYDAYGRVIARHQHFSQEETPQVRTVRWQYVAHSDGDHPESISVELTQRGAQ